MKSHCSVLVIALVLSVTPQFSAQQTPAPVPGVIRINVNLVQMDAVVTDSKGKPVTDLKADDFEVLQDGKKQQIRNFEFVSLKGMPSGFVVPRTVVPSAGPGAPPLSPPAPRVGDVRRTISLVVDDLALSFDSTVSVRDSLKQWVNTEMQAGDLVSVVRTNAAMGALQQFTNDKRLLFSAIERLKFQPGRIGVQSFTPMAGVVPGILSAPDTAQFDRELANAHLIGSLNAIRYVMRGLRDLPGRKSVILFTEDMALTKLDLQRQSVEDLLRKLVDDANRSSIVLYAIDPRGSIYTGPTASDNLSNREPAEIAAMASSRLDQITSSQDGMVLLAERTGGVFYSNSNDLTVPLRKAANDGDGYYLMGYQPDQASFSPHVDTVKYHSIKVRVKRPGLKVRSRSGFFGVDDTVPASSPNAQTQIAKALVSPFMTSDLSIRLTALFAHSDKDGAHIETLLSFDPHELTFKEEADGVRKASVDIALATFNEDGDPENTVHKTWQIRVTKDEYDQMMKKAIVYSAFVPVKKAGPYQLRVALRDTTSEKLGSAMQFIDVPDVAGGRLALSGIVVASAAPSPNDTEGTPAVRIFKSGESIAYAYQIMNAQTGGKDTLQLETQVRLYHDGQVVYESKPPLETKAGDKNAKRLPVGGRLKLTRIPPGSYVMQVVVLDNLRNDKNRFAAQTIDFEVR